MPKKTEQWPFGDLMGKIIKIPFVFHIRWIGCHRWRQSLCWILEVADPMSHNGTAPLPLHRIDDKTYGNINRRKYWMGCHGIGLGIEVAIWRYGQPIERSPGEGMREILQTTSKLGIDYEHIPRVLHHLEFGIWGRCKLDDITCNIRPSNRDFMWPMWKD